MTPSRLVLASSLAPRAGTDMPNGSRSDEGAPLTPDPAS